MCNGDRNNDQVSRNGSVLTMEPGGYNILRLCSDLRSVEGPDNQTQISFPVLSVAERPLGFALLREWLQECDDSHDECGGHEYKRLPTRLLYVGDPGHQDYNPNFLKLVPGSEIGVATYVALSHCWGESNEVLSHCTTRGNISDRQVEFSIADLPLTFRDAVKVARGLKVQYLWIDSLCIMQGKDGDWKKESKRMEDVYTSAYCTIAATSAADSNAGFLKRNIEYVYLQDNSGRQVYVGTDIADFDKEVEGARLNTRAWVMQERLLSRRTIHFGTNQMYWECGEGIYCEDLTRLRCARRSKKHFRLDPKFPNLLFRSGFKTTLGFLESLLEDYSTRGLSTPTDRAVALSGLAARIASVLSCKENYGIFGYFLHRNLLWQRSNMQSTMKPIEYTSCDVPSWSWMAYPAGIEFMDVNFGQLDLFTNLDFDGNDKQALITNVWEFQDCHLKEEGNAELKVARREILDSRETERGWIMYNDERGGDLLSERSVVVGRMNGEYYMLIVKRTAVGNEYKRVGTGVVQRDYVSRQEADIRVL